jgi:hypothetical protein
MNSTKLILSAAVLGVSVNHSSAAPPSSPARSVQGTWASAPGHEHMILTADASGGRIEMDCASGTLAGPMTTDGNGKFQTTGTFEQHAPGPQRADKALAAVKTRFTGELHNGVLTLTVLTEGGSAPQVFQLREGARVKLLRCL